MSMWYLLQSSNAVARSNVDVNIVTCETSQVARGWLNLDASLKMAPMVMIFEVLQVPRG